MKSTSLLVALGLLLHAVLSAGPFAQERPAKDVTMPTVVSEVKPDYPESVKRERIQGDVTLEAVVKQDGTVGDVTVKKPLHPELDEAAVAAMKKWRFRPGTKNGKAVDVAVDVEMTFTLR